MVNLIIDTDIGNDCDDAAALALAFIYVKRKQCRLLCCTVNTSDEFAADCIDAIAARYGETVETGVYRGRGFPANPKSYCRAVAERFGTVKGVPRREAVALLREKLAASKRKSVTLVCIGQLNNLRALLESEADAYGKDGVRLVKEKVRKVVVMGGMFGKEEVLFDGKPYRAEFNIATSVPDSVGALRLCPVPVVFADFLLGMNVVALGELTGFSENDPVGYAYELFCGKGNGRPSWDILTVMYALEGKKSPFRLSPRGTVTVTQEGYTVFSRKFCGKHRYLTAEKSTEEMRRSVELPFVLP